MATIGDRLQVAGRTGGVPGVLAVALGEAIRLLRAKVSGNPYQKILPKYFASGTLTLSGTSGVTTDFVSSEFKNDGKYPYVMEELLTINVTGSTNWRLSVKDASTLETFFGAPNRIRVNQIVDSNRQPTGIGRVRHEVDPNGGFLPTAESVGTADTVELVLKGYWVIEE